MKKIRLLALLFCLTSLTTILFNGCVKTNPLYDCVSELRLNLYQGSCEEFTLKAGYGYKEQPYDNDGAICQKVYQLNFRLMDKEMDNVTYKLTLKYDGQTYTGDFALDPISDAITTRFEINDFTADEFNVTLSYGGTDKEIIMKSIIPSGTITYKTVLDKIYQNESALIKAYTDQNGKITAEIYVRVIVKEQKPYWYIGFANGNGNLKAMLMDGFSGELLAIREVF